MDLDAKPPNKSDEWTVSAALLRAENGSAQVEIGWTNGGAGPLPPFVMVVDWKPGAEARDVEALALTLAGQSADFLHRAFLKAAVDRHL